MAPVRRLLAVGLALLAASPAVAPAAEPGPPAGATGVTRADIGAVVANPADGTVFERLLAKLPRVTLDDNGTPRRYYLWQGDLLLDRAGVFALLFANLRKPPIVPGSKELAVLRDADGKDVFWPRDRRALTYAVDCASFPTADACATLTGAVAAAASAWVDACPTCGLTLTKVAMPAGGRVVQGQAPLFIVRYQPQEQGYVAVAFFPNDAAFKRTIFVAPSWFTITGFDRTGILRHELGHVLGYRHEHTRKVAGCYYEDGNWRPLTDYDGQSVMHYFCGGHGTRTLKLSRDDIKGHRSLYGAR